MNPMPLHFWPLDDGLRWLGGLALGSRPRVRRAAVLLAAAVAGLSTGACLACVSPPRTPMRDQLQTATTVTIFQLESSEYLVEPLGEGIEMRLLRGRLKVVETLKGLPARFTRLEINLSCNDLRMDVGDFFLVATTQQGRALTLGVVDATVMHVSAPDARARLQSTDLQAVRAFLKGTPLPAGFGSQAAPYTQKYFLPPPCRR